MFERFTDRARRVVVLAQEEARMLSHNYIGTEHILLGLIHEGEGVAAKALESLGISLEAVRAQVEEIIGQGQQAPSGHIPFTPRAKKVLELSLREALQLGHNYIGTEHILLGLIREGEGVAAQVLVKLGADLNRVRQQVIQLLSGFQGKETAAAGAPQEGAPSSSLVLDQFGRNYTQAAREGKLDPVIGREKEIERVMQVLSRRTKNNPVLIGEPGVGKTAMRRGPRPGDRARRRARDAQGQADLQPRPRVAGGRLSLPRRLRGAPEEGAQGDQDPRRHRAVHRRAAHPGRCRRGRGRDRRRLDPQADAGPRRAADDRRDHARRVPQAPREGRRPRAPVPADPGARAVDRPHHRDPQGPARPLRGAPPGDHHRRGAGLGGDAGRPLRLRPVPAGQGDRPDRRGRLPAADPPDDRAAGPARVRRQDRRRTTPQGGRDRQPGLRAGRVAARRGEEADPRQGRAREAVEGRRHGRRRRGRRGADRRGARGRDRHPDRQAVRGGVRPGCSRWRTSCTSGSSVRTRPSRHCPGRSGAPVPGSRTRSVPAARSSSPGPLGSARRGCPRRWRSSCSATRTR